MRGHYGWFLASVIASLLAAPSYAAIVGCTVGGQDRVVFDTNADHQPNSGPNPGTDPQDDDGYWTFSYDDVAHVLMIEGHGFLPVDLPTFHERILFRHTENGAASTFEEILDHVSGSTTYHDLNDCHRVNMVKAILTGTGAGLGIQHIDVRWLRANPGGASVLNCIPGDENTLGGVEGFPLLQWSADDLAFSGDLVDSNADGVYDRRQGVFQLNTTASPWVVGLLVDAALQYFPSAANRQYLVLPQSMVVYVSANPSGPFDAFVPVQNDRVSLVCNGQTVLEAPLGGAPQGGGVTGAPLLDRFALAALPIALLVIGVWWLRKNGIRPEIWE